MELFDLNIEEVLEHWGVEHAIREVIANALDERLLSRTAEIEITEDGNGRCVIRDYGRGLAIEHFTLSENEEKLAAPDGLIGKFGVGLKDALATFHRRGVEVTMRSPHGTFALREASKHNFDGITTLHVEAGPGINGMVGTEVEIRGVSHDDIARAKDLFLHFSGEQPIEGTPYGEILRRGSGDARVYINGVLANEESNFLFSYNITSLTAGMRSRLNRERLNVGRTTYAERVKSILKSAKSEQVEKALADQVIERSRGTQCDEMQWIDVSEQALGFLHRRSQVAFVTERETTLHPHVVDNMRSDGYEVVLVDDAQKGKLAAQVDTGADLHTLEGYIEEFNESFRYKFVQPEYLTPQEQKIYSQTPALLELVGISTATAPPVRISETMRVSLDTTEGVWDAERGEIVIKREQLASLASYAATLLHEAAHATSGAVDATREFESVLTEFLGSTAAAALV